MAAALSAVASEHWAYQLPKKVAAPEIQDRAWVRNDIDRFVLAKLEEKQIRPVSDADKAVLARRVYFDLIGLPPTPEQIDQFVAAPIEQSVDRLLQSPHFGERWARHWLDVVRFAESVNLRGFVFKEAWRYRDY